MRPSFRPRWRPLGPSDAVGGTNMGRVNCIEFDPKNVKIIYLCGADGGIWKSTNGGATWLPKSDFEPTLSVGDIAIDQKKTNGLYVANSHPLRYHRPLCRRTHR